MKYLELHRKQSRFFGLWHNAGDRVYYLNTIFQLAVQFLYLISAGLFIALEDYNFQTLIRTGNMISICWIATYRIIVWLIYEKDIQDIFTFSTSDNFDQTHPIIKRGHKIAYYYSCYLSTVAAGIVISSYIPIIYQIIVKQDNFENASLPYSNWFPFNIHTTRVKFIIAIFYQMHAFWANIVMLATIHSTFLSFMVKVSAHFELVAEHLSQINALELDAEEKFKKCVVQLENNYRLARSINEINSLGLTGQFIPIFFIVCACLIVITTQPLNSAGPEIIFGTACLFDLFVYCWFGEQIYYQSNQVHMKLCEINWNEGSTAFRKSVLLTMLKLNKGTIFYVGGFLPLQLPTFVQTIRATYSIYTLLKEFA